MFELSKNEKFNMRLPWRIHYFVDNLELGRVSYFVRGVINLWVLRMKHNLDKKTLSNIARSLWLEEFDESQIDKVILKAIYSDKNSNDAFTQRHIELLKFLKNNRLDYTPNYKNRYEVMLQNSNNLSPLECYTRSNFFGPESVIGYEPLSTNPLFNFPDIDLPQLQHQVGWHFFVGHAYDINKNNYSIQVMFWQYALLPPFLAKQFGLTDIENQIIDLHVAVSDENNNIHYRAEPTIIAGTSGLLSVTEAPYSYMVGRNKIISLDKSSNLFPLKIEAFGIDKDRKTNIKINLNLNKNKDALLQGDGGCCPSIDGIGTLYYSVPNISIFSIDNYIELNSQKIVLTEGKFWYDHQWGTGFKPNGALKSPYMRTIQFLKKANPGGWDWFMVQFFAKDGKECEMSFAAIHKNTQYLYNTSDHPPPTNVEKVLSGKFIQDDGSSLNIKGTMVINKWAKSQTSPNSECYKITSNWYPISFNVEIDSDIPECYKKFTMRAITSTPQTGFFADSIEYSEGGSNIIDSDGNVIGHGFIESTGYSNNITTMLKHSALPINEDTLKFNQKISLTFFEKVFSSINFLLNLRKIFKNLKTSKGMSQN